LGSCPNVDNSRDFLVELFPKVKYSGQAHFRTSKPVFEFAFVLRAGIPKKEFEALEDFDTGDTRLAEAGCCD
jgi:hypothetical protein